MYDDLIARLERQYGLEPGELAAIRGQESTDSTDLGLLGPVTRHGQAKGPFQIMEKWHGPLPPTFEGQAELAAQILARGGRTPDERARSYYGRGVAQPGMPTGDEYVAQVAKRRASMADRIPGAGPLLASAGTDADYPPGTPPERRSTGASPMNEAAGLLEALTGSQGGAMGADSLIAALTGGAPQKKEGLGGFWDALNSNPFWHMGLATAAAPGFGGNAWRAISTGMLAGQQNYEKMRQLTEERQQQSAKLKLDALSTMSKLRQQAYQQAYMQQLAKQYPEYAAAINAGFGEKVVENLLGVKPPEVKEFEEGAEKVSKQWDPKTGTWKEIARGPRWNPNGQNIITGYDAEGRPIGIMSGATMGKPAQNKVEEQQFNANESIGRLSKIRAGFKPEYQQFGNQVGMEWTRLKDRFNEASPHEKKKFAEYTGWRSGAINNLNMEIKQLTGAAMTEAEAQRLLAGLPNPGTGPTNPGDSPTEFQAKLDAAIDGAKQAAIRASLAKQYGLDWRQIPLDQVESQLLDRYMQDRAKALEAQGVAADEAERQAAAAIMQEFGL